LKALFRRIIDNNRLVSGADTATASQRVGLGILYAYLASPIVIQAAMVNWGDIKDPVFMFNIVVTILWISLAHLAVRRPLLLHLLLLPLYISTAVDLFLLDIFGARLTSAYVAIALGNRSDTGEFISTFIRPILLVCSVFLVIYVTGLYFVRHLRKPRSPKLALLNVLALVAAYSALTHHFHLWPGEPFELIALDDAAHETSAPMGAIFQTGVALRIHANNVKIIERRAGFSFGASKPQQAGEEIYVWVIGESSRPNNWSLFGYARDTTPKLRAISGITTFTNMMTTAPETQLAVPSMVSLRPITDWASVQAEKSVVSAFKEAGFKTYWLSTQDVDGWSGIVPQVAAEAGTLRYFNESFDGVLLDVFRGILQQEPRGRSKLFIVLHTDGSHFDYKNRFPAEFARFFTPHGSRRDNVVDAYDNSVLYTDWFLAELISMLRERNTHAALLYASDHGENLLDDDRQLMGHTRGTRYDLFSSSFIWLSDELQQSNPNEASNLQRHAQLPLSLSNLPHSMLELAGIQAAERDLRSSIFSSAFEVQPRFYLFNNEVRREQGEGPSRSSAARAP
jgi:glucan phosphoethanolaminetransferase (alkaline phosphatase superfamily)